MPADEEAMPWLRAERKTVPGGAYRLPSGEWVDAHGLPLARVPESPPDWAPRQQMQDDLERTRLRDQQRRENEQRRASEAVERAAWMASPEYRARWEAAGPNGLNRIRRVLELHAAGWTDAAIAADMPALRHPGTIGTEQVRTLYQRGLRFLRHPRRTAERAEYEAAGTFTPWW
jgi:hypothetical protein